MFLPMFRPKQDVGVNRTVVKGIIMGALPNSQGDGFTCPKCRRGVATNVCPFDGVIIVGGRGREPFVPKGTIPFRPPVVPRG